MKMVGDVMNTFLLRLSSKRSGSALPMVIIVFVVVTILLSSVFVLSMNNTKQVATQEQSIHSSYIARSGAEAMFQFLVAEDTSKLAAYDSWPDAALQNVIINFTEGVATVSVDKTTYDSRDRVRIISVGKANNTNVTSKVILEFDLVGYGNIDWSR
ncbi:hypothetical protein [Gudongella oleilytica]|jgi:hypothetical protein|uniref:hypothetical protein n=1 Tax=Gudongella oleilytica TaxID=1582259 RepID=UPI002A35F222|nr:hypothetical protein [Gudongella oleilytica]